MNVALYGGTFNPPHNGHIHVACEVHRLLAIDEVIFIPSYIPPHKSPKGIIKAHHRFEMVKVATAPFPFCTVSDIEVASEQVCYTVDTVRALVKEHPEWETVYCIVGADSIPEIYTWKLFKNLAEEVTIVVHTRKGYGATQRDERFMYLESADYEASSTELRHKIRERAPYEEWVPQAVGNYIKQHDLYRN